MRKIIIALLILTSLSAASQDSVLLRFNLKKGDTYEVVMNMKQNMAPVMNMNIAVNMIMESLGKEGGDVNTSSKFKRMALKMSAGAEEISFDSNDKEGDLNEEEKKMRAEMEPFLNMIVHRKFDKYGKVVDMKLEPNVKGANQFMDQAELTTMVYPEEALKVGSKWDHKQAVSGTDILGTYTVTKITENRLYADFLGKAGANGEGQMKGTVEIDTKSGMIVDMKLSLNMSQGGMSMDIGINVTSKKIN